MAHASDKGELKQEYIELLRMRNPQKRGIRFNAFVRRILESSRLRTEPPAVIDGSAADLVFEVENHQYLVEAKWESEPIGMGPLYKLRGELDQRPTHPRGVFISHSGFAPSAIEGARRLPLVLLVREDLLWLLDGKVSLPELLRAKEFWSVATGSVGTPASEVVPFFRGRRDIRGFCQRLGLSDKKFLALPKVFVPPREYADMQRALRSGRVVFIVGDPHLGKTYTALSLLFESFCEGYEPLWRREVEREEQHKDVTERREEILTGQRAIFMEDPFGKAEYEGAHALGVEVQRLLLEVQGSSCRFIVTSREAIFQEAKEREPVSFSKAVEPYVYRLNLFTPSYDRPSLERILRNYQDLYKPSYLSDPELEAWAESEALKELAAPHNLEYFVSISVDASTRQKDHCEYRDCKEAR